MGPYPRRGVVDILVSFNEARQAALSSQDVVVQAFVNEEDGRAFFDWQLKNGVMRSVKNQSQAFNVNEDAVRFDGVIANEKPVYRVPLNPYGVNEKNHTFWQEGQAMRAQLGSLKARGPGSV